MVIRVRIGLVAARIGVAVKTLHRWEISGDTSCTQTAGGHRRVSLAEIRASPGNLKELVVRTRSRHREMPGSPCIAGCLHTSKKPRVTVNPNITFKICNHCGKIGEKKGKPFRCTNLECGPTLDSDFNAARGIHVAPLSPGATRARGGCPLPPIQVTGTA
ncbi:transposase [Candidatus Bathyarchaeota archaeon]|nr:transposase [Candidatus Bathyarchaeota archaeon]